MRAFVTGGTGFVGSHLVEALLNRGDDVRALVRRDAKWLHGLPIETVRGDLFSREALTDGLRGCDTVFHVAGLTRAPTREALNRVNVEGTLSLLRRVEDAAPGVGRVVIVSSLAAVGPSGPEPLTEEAPLRPLSAYGRSKAQMEQALRGPSQRLPVTVVRPPAVYGPRETDIYTVLRAADRQRVFPVVGDPEVMRMALVHVADLVRGIIAAAEHPDTAGKTYFLGGPRNVSWAELHHAVTAALGHRAVRVRVPPALVRPIGVVAETLAGWLGRYPPLNREKAREAVAAWLVSSDRARREIGYAPRVSLTEGMRSTVDWYRGQGWL